MELNIKGLIGIILLISPVLYFPPWSSADSIINDFAPPADTPSCGAPVLNEKSELILYSENISVHIAESAFVKANFTFYNPSPDEVEEIIRFPFHFEPFNLSITVNETILNFSFNFTGYSVEDSSPDVEEYYSYIPAECSVQFKGKQFVTINVEYTRVYLTNNFYYPVYLNSFIFQNRFDFDYDEPIRYGHYQFFVDKRFCTGHFDNGSIYRDYYNEHWTPQDFKEYDLYAAAFHTNFLTEYNITNDSCYYLSQEFFDWMPEQDIGLIWIHYGPVADINISFDIKPMKLNLNVSGTDSYDCDGQVCSYNWRFSKRDQWMEVFTNSSFSYTLDSRGQHGILLAVKDDMDFEGSHDYMYFFVNSPIDEIEFDVFNMYNFGWLDPENVKKCQWEFGDGHCSEGNLVRHRYPSTGVYEMNLRVTYSYHDTDHVSQGLFYVVIVDLDSDNDGVVDSVDAFPFNGTEWNDTDGDNIGDNSDRDIDGDGWDNFIEIEMGTDPYNNHSFPGDVDDDTIPDILDDDIDGDGWNNTFEMEIGTDAWDNSSFPIDTDADGIFDPFDPDIDDDGWNNTVETQVGTDPFDKFSFPSDLDGDGIPDAIDPDVDNDGWNDTEEVKYGTDPYDILSLPSDLDNDSIPDAWDEDRDGDGVKNVDDAFPYDGTLWDIIMTPQDSDNDGYNDTFENASGSDPYDIRSTPLDRDGDEHPNDEDAYPDDASRWELGPENDDSIEEENAGMNYIWAGIILGVIIALAVILTLLFLKKKARETHNSDEDLGRVEEQKNENE